MQMRVMLLAVLASAGCLRETQFRCTDNSQCGASGTCQPAVGFCSFPDNGCSSGQRFGDLSGGVAGTCVVFDAGMPDAPPDAACMPEIGTGVFSACIPDPVASLTINDA